MAIKNRKNIKLLNYSTSTLCVSSGKKEYTFEGAREGSPVAYYFDWDEIDGINTRSSAIKTGALAFEEADRKEGYAALKLFDWENTILFEDKMDDIITNPTIENLERILAIRDIHTIERFRGKVLSYINNGRGIDSRFIDVVNGRFKEINNGVLNTRIVLRPIVKHVPANAADVDALKAQNESMANELAEMKAMVAELMKEKK